MTHTGRTLWTELPLHVREYLITEAPEWLILTLQRLRLGAANWVPKAGQMPRPEQRSQARIRYAELRAEGIPYRKRLRIISAELQVHTRTIQGWLVKPGPSAEGE